MNSPSEMLQAIHQMVSGLPEQLSATLGAFQQPDVGNFSSFDAPGLGSSEEPNAAGPDPEIGDFPSLPDFGMPDAAEQEFPGVPSMGDSAFPSLEATGFGGTEADFPTLPGFSGSEAGFPSLPGFSGAASSMPGSTQFSQDSELIDTLRDLRDSLQSGPSSPGFQRSGGPVQVNGQRVYIGGDDDYSQSSPSVNAGNSAGLNGAGGRGLGSQYSSKSFLGGGGQTEQDHYLGR